jgi:hypothetical protein
MIDQVLKRFVLMMMMSRIGRAHIRKEERESEIERGEERRKIDVTELSLKTLAIRGRGNRYDFINNNNKNKNRTKG